MSLHYKPMMGRGTSVAKDGKTLLCSPFQAAGVSISLLVLQAAQHGRRWVRLEARS